MLVLQLSPSLAYNPFFIENTDPPSLFLLVKEGDGSPSYTGLNTSKIKP